MDQSDSLDTADHPITISDSPVRADVTTSQTTLADNAEALELHEAGYPPVLYFKPGHVSRSRLIPSDHSTTCPHKGKASYFHVNLDGGGRLDNAAWCYREPHEAVAAIKDHIAFYPDKLDIKRR
ncbi:DUF427 domain-containing protein [Maricaulis sp. CAU 1757]